MAAREKYRLYLAFRLIMTTNEPLKFNMKVDHNYKCSMKQFIC